MEIVKDKTTPGKMVVGADGEYYKGDGEIMTTFDFAKDACLVSRQVRLLLVVLIFIDAAAGVLMLMAL